jgi:hypothetical protein
MFEVARMNSSLPGIIATKMQSDSLSHSSFKQGSSSLSSHTSHLSSGISSILRSGAGIGPARQVWMLSTSLNTSLRSLFNSFLQVWQWFGHQLIFTMLVCQSTSGLCSQSQVRPRMISCRPILVTVKVTHSEWSRKCSTTSTTSKISPASFNEPSTL